MRIGNRTQAFDDAIFNDVDGWATPKPDVKKGHAIILHWIYRKRRSIDIELKTD